MAAVVKPVGWSREVRWDFLMPPSQLGKIFWVFGEWSILAEAKPISKHGEVIFDDASSTLQNLPRNSLASKKSSYTTVLTLFPCSVLHHGRHNSFPGQFPHFQLGHVYSN